MATQVTAPRSSTAAPKTLVLCVAALAAILMTLQFGGQVSPVQSPQTVQAPERATDVTHFPGRPN